MAFSNITRPAESTTATAGADLRAHQYKGVHVTGGGVLLATAAVNSGPVYVLYNTPNSGDQCTLYGPGNTVEAVAGGTIALGNWVTCSNGAFVSIANSAVESGAALRVGAAHSAVASGGRFALRML